MKNKFLILALVINIMVLFMSVVYSSFHTSTIVKDISAEVRPITDVRVTGVSASSSGDAKSSNTDYNVSDIVSDISFNEETAKVIFEVEVTNFGNTEMGIYDITGLPSGLTYSISGYTKQEKIYDNTKSEDKYTNNAKQTFSITVEYESVEAFSNSASHDYTMTLHFDFRGYHNIYYNSSKIGEVIAGGDKTISLGDSPDAINVSGTYDSKSYIAPTLTLTNVESDIYITKQSSEPTDSYDPTHLQEGTNTYPSSPGSPTVSVSNGVVTSYEFTDTSGTNLSEESDGIDTGFVPFSGGKNFELKIRAYYPQSQNKAAGGVLVDIRDRVNKSTDLLQISYAKSTSSSVVYPRIYVNNNSGKALTPKNDIVDINMTYKDGILSVTCNGTNVYSQAASFSLDGITILLGYTMSTSGSVLRQATATIYEFYVREIE